MNAVKVCSLLVSMSALFAGCSSTPVTTPQTETAVTPAATTATTRPTTTTASTSGASSGTASSASSMAANSLSLDPASRARLRQELSQLDAAARASLLQQRFGAADAAARSQFLAQQGLAHLDPSSRLAKERSVFFDFDKFAVRDADSALVELHGRYLAANSDLSIKVEGNADERGSKEYNLALGQKRAESVVRALKALGIKDNQAEPVSFGEEKPMEAGHNEAAWGKNRRADVNYGVK